MGQRSILRPMLQRPWKSFCILVLGSLILTGSTQAQNPFEQKPASENPFEQGAAKGETSPLAGVWQGDGIELELKEAAPGRLAGTLKRDGSEFPAEGKSAGNLLSGRFKAGTTEFDFTLEKDASGAAVFVTSICLESKATPSSFSCGTRSRIFIGRMHVQTESLSTSSNGLARPCEMC